MDVASLQVRVSTQGVESTQRELDKLSGTAGKAEKSVGGLASSIKTLGTVATIGAFVSLGKEAVKMADSYKLVEARLSLVTKGTLELANAQQSLFNISQNTRQSFKETADLYASLARSTQQLGKTQTETLRVTETINKAIIISGASAQSAQAALVQLGQGFASGTLRGEELNSVLEQTPRIAEAIAKGMGVTIGQLRALGAEGSLTGEAVFEALQKQAKAVDEEFAKIPPTVGQATIQIGNSLTLLAGTLDKATGATDALARSFSDLSKTISDTALSMDVANKSVFSLKTADEFDKKTKLITDEINELRKALETDDGFLWFGLDERTTGEYQNRIKRLEQQLKQLGDTRADVAKSLAPSLDDAMRAFQNSEKAYRSTFNPSKEEIEAEKKSTRERISQAEKLAEYWAKRKIELATETAIAEQDEMSKPYILLQAQYEADLKEFGSQKGAKEELERNYQAELQKLNQETVKKFEDGLEKEAKKSAEWQVKLLEANEKYNEEIIKMRDEMYGTDTSIEAWYDNQLEYLGKLSQEAGATAEELQTLLDKIEMIKAMKLEKQTISFKVEQSFYNSFEDNLADSIEGAFNGKLDLSSFFRNIGQDVLRTFSGGISNNITSALRTGSFTSGLNALGLGSTSAVASDGGILSDLSTLSTIKSLYGLASNGISGSVLGGFNSIAGGFDALGMTGAGNTIGQFGYGFANPFSANTSFGAIGAGSTVGGMALGGLGGYALGTLGDKLFGADTKAGTIGAVGGSIGMAIAGPVGAAVGAVLGSAVGGLFGSTKQKDAGLSFGSTTGMGKGFEEIQAYADMQKKSWFSNKKWTNYTDLSDSEVRQIKGIFDTYDFLLNQLGDTDRIILEAGKYTGQSFQDVVAKKFIEAFTDVSQTTDDTIYQAWVAYAESIDSTVIEALTASINTFISATRTFDVWALNRSGQGIEALAKQAQWAQEDFSNLSNMLGATGVTVENYTQMYKEAVKNSLTPETITQWQSLGTALMTATNAADAYKNSIISGLQQDLTAWISALGSIQNAMDNLNPTFMTFAELASQTINLDNYSTLLSQLEKTRQNEIAKLTTAANERIEQLEAEKSLFTTLADFVEELTQKIIGYSVTTSSYFFSELANAKALISSGGTPDVSLLKSSASSYLDKALGQSASELEYLREVAKVREGIGGLGDLATGGSLEGIENAIKQEEQTLAEKLDEINQTALAILAGYKGTANSNISRIASEIKTVKTVDPLITQAYNDILARNPEETGGAYWQKQLETGAIKQNNITTAIAAAAVEELYATVLGRESDAAGLAHWTNVVQSGSINPTQLDELFKEAAKAEINGSHATGLDYVPFDGYLAELHKGERVQTASEVQKDTIIVELQNSLKDLKDMFIKNIAETSRMSRVITRLDDNDALLVRVVV